MKLNPFMTVIAVLISALISYFIYYISGNSEQIWVYTIGCFVCVVSSMIPMLALKHPESNRAVNIRVSATIFLVVFLFTNGLFVLFRASEPLYIVVNGILFLINIGSVYRLCTVKLS